MFMTVCQESGDWKAAAFRVIIAVNQVDMQIGDWSTINPEMMRGLSEDDLHFIMAQNRGGDYDKWASNELNRRRILELQSISISLLEATNTMTKRAEA
jgi:hypothetical protein